MKKYSAFTLFELLITVAIISVLALVALPSFSSYTQDSAMVANTNGLLGSLNLARSEAITRAKRVSVCASANAMTAVPSCASTGKWQNGWVTWVDNNSNNAIDVGEKIVRVVGKAKGADVTICSKNKVVSFVSTGLPQTTSGLNLGETMLFSDARGTSKERIVRVYASGRIRGAAGSWSCK